MHQCLSCQNKKFNTLVNLQKFPIYWGALAKKFIHRVKYYPLKIGECESCGLVQQTKILSKNIMDKIYETENYLCPSPEKSGMGKREILKFYDFFKKQNLKKCKILEIACYDCYLLKKMYRDNWDMYGCDPSIDTKNFLKNFPKDRVKKEFFDKSSYPAGTFDVIIFRNLLEHIEDLNQFLSEVSYALKENGHIFIDVPNMKEINKIGGFGLFFHQHLSYFAIPTLSKLLEKNNFVISDYYEGRPNLFIKAKKISRKIKIKKKIIIKSNNLKNSLKIKKKILNIFNDKKNKKIILFGASALCTTIINFLNATQRKKIILVSDNDKEKFNKILCGSKFTIKSPNLIEKLKFDVLLICSYFFIEEIVKSILEKGVRREKIKKLI